MENMKYKVGDKVRIKSIDWYNENKGVLGNVECGDALMTFEKARFCGKIVTISSISDVTDTYKIDEDNEIYDWTDEMIEGLVEGKTYPYKIGDRVILKGSNRCATITDLKYNCQGNLSYYIKVDNDKDISIDYPTDLLLPIECEVEEEEIEFTEEDKFWCDIMSESDPTTYVLPQGYQFVDEHGNVINATKIVLEKKKKEYPKTYVGCCDTLYRNSRHDECYEACLQGHPMQTFARLLICRDAYWKLYGEEMGLGKPWEPDYKNPDIDLYVIINSYNQVDKAKYGYGFPVRIFTFPTEEMRDAFYENFKSEIECCKELL